MGRKTLSISFCFIFLSDELHINEANNIHVKTIKEKTKQQEEGTF